MVGYEVPKSRRLKRSKKRFLHGFFFFFYFVVFFTIRIERRGIAMWFSFFFFFQEGSCCLICQMSVSLANTPFHFSLCASPSLVLFFSLSLSLSLLSLTHSYNAILPLPRAFRARRLSSRTTRLENDHVGGKTSDTTATK